MNALLKDYCCVLTGRQLKRQPVTLRAKCKGTLTESLTINSVTTPNPHNSTPLLFPFRQSRKKKEKWKHLNKTHIKLQRQAHRLWFFRQVSQGGLCLVSFPCFGSAWTFTSVLNFSYRSEWCFSDFFIIMDTFYGILVSGIHQGTLISSFLNCRAALTITGADMCEGGSGL